MVLLSFHTATNTVEQFPNNAVEPRLVIHLLRPASIYSYKRVSEATEPAAGFPRRELADRREDLQRFYGARQKRSFERQFPRGR